MKGREYAPQKAGMKHERGKRDQQDTVMWEEQTQSDRKVAGKETSKPGQIKRMPAEKKIQDQKV